MTPNSANSRVYTDFSGLANLKAAAKTESPEAIKQVAKEFEASFVEMMMKSLRDASESEGMLDNEATRMYQDMFDKQIAVDISERGEMGIAQVIEKQLTKGHQAPEAPKEQMPTIERGLSGFGPSNQIRQLHERANNPFNSTGLITEKAPFDLNDNVNKSTAQVQPLIDLNQRSRSIYDQARQAQTDKAVRIREVNVTLRDDPVANRTTFRTPEEFIETLRPHAEKAAEELGVNPNILIAQAALETGWGKKVIKHPNGETSYNLFGIKANRSWDGDAVRVGSLEYRNGIARREVSPFRAYSSFEDSFKDYVDFIKNQPRYGDAIDNAGNSKSYIKELQQAGYATDPNYARKVINIMERESLKPAWTG